MRLADYCANCMVPLYTEPERKLGACQRCLGATNAELVRMLAEDESEATDPGEQEASS